jgi:hypothetical protein
MTKAVSRCCGTSGPDTVRAPSDLTLRYARSTCQSTRIHIKVLVIEFGSSGLLRVLLERHPRRTTRTTSYHFCRRCPSFTRSWTPVRDRCLLLDPPWTQPPPAVHAKAWRLSKQLGVEIRMNIPCACQNALLDRPPWRILVRGMLADRWRPPLSSNS